MSKPNNLELNYTIFCEDIRVEASGSLSLMGLFHQIVVPQLPVGLIKFAVLNHWQGEGQFETKVRILSPDREAIVVSQPNAFEIAPNGYSDNVSVFINTTFQQPGDYIVQTLINNSLFAEKILPVFLANQQPAITESEHVN